jgi:hypothetical protein
MILIAAALACVASVPLSGGRLGRLLDLQLRWGWAALSALALQIIITTLAPGGSTGLHELLHIASYALAGACIIANRRIAGLPILALGAALNSLAIVANAGIMPASARAMRLAGHAPSDHFANSASVAHPRLHALLHIASYALAAACIIANRRIAGLPILALGAALNSLAIIANAGIMPASARAMRLAGLAPSDHFANSASVAHPRLLALGDVIPIPGPWPLGNVISIGDILIIAGLLTVLHRASRDAPSTPLSGALPSPPGPEVQAAAHKG